MSDVMDRFAEARGRESQLNGRQREVLDLLVAGKTNGEIGEILGMTLDGAKWNVGEILGKLALTSREEAADYWRWRRSRRSPVGALRGLFGLGTLKWVGGGLATIAVVGVLAGLLSRAEEKESGDLPPFYLEARIEVLDQSRSIGTNIAESAGAETEPERRVATVRWWWKDADNSRVEIETIEPELDSGTDMILMDGDEQIYYRQQTNTYSRTPLYDFPPEAKLRIRPWSFSSFLGPWGTEVKDLDELMSQLQQFGSDDVERTVEIVGEEMMLGVRATIIELSPVNSSTGRDGTVTSGGSARYWVDAERLVVLRQEFGSEGVVEEFVMEVTKLDWDTRIAPDRFRFEPPRGSEQDGRAEPNPLADAGGSTSSAGSSNLGGTSVNTPPGMLRTTTLPEGFLVRGTEASHDAGTQPNRLKVEYATENGESFVIDQRIRAGGPGAPFPGEETKVRGVPAFVVEEGGEVSVMWAEGELIVRIASASLTREELLAVAESLEPVP